MSAGGGGGGFGGTVLWILGSISLVWVLFVWSPAHPGGIQREAYRISSEVVPALFTIGWPLFLLMLIVVFTIKPIIGVFKGLFGGGRDH